VFAVATLPAFLLVSGTSTLTLDIAPMPFLWIPPLLVYQAGFVVAFSRRAVNTRAALNWLLAASAVYLYVFLDPRHVPMWVQIPIILAIIGAASVFLHGEAARRAPPPGALASFYLLLGAGGIVGGLAATFLPPLFLGYFWEFPLGVTALWAFVWFLRRRGGVGTWPELVGPRVPAVLAIVLVILIGVRVQGFSARNLWVNRNFYGVSYVSRIEDPGSGDPMYQLGNNSTVHGRQFIDDERRLDPSTYYHPANAAAAAMDYLRDREGRVRVGIIGLGTGALSAFSAPGDKLDFFEINPDVIRLARGKGATSIFSIVHQRPCG
jgi:hypothetical protein